MNRQSRAVAYGLGAVLSWSTVATAFKLTLVYLSPAQLVLVAVAVSWVFFLAVLIATGRLHQLRFATPADCFRSVLLGLFNPLLYYLILLRAYDLLPAQEAQALNYTWALTMGLLAAPVLRHRLRPIELLAAGVSYTGVYVIACRGDILAMEFASPVGVGLALLSTVLWALYWLLNTAEQREPVVALFLNFTCALPLLLLYCGWRGELYSLPWRGVAGAFYIGLFEMGVSYVLWLHAMRLTASALRISSLIFLAPVLSLLIIHQVLGEQILSSTYIGLAFILAGLAMQYFIPALRQRVAG